MKVRVINDNNDRFLIFFQFHIFYEVSEDELDGLAEKILNRVLTN